MKTLHVKLQKQFFVQDLLSFFCCQDTETSACFFSYADTGVLWSVFLPLMLPLAAILESSKLSRLVFICFMFNFRHTCFYMCLKKINSKILKYLGQVLQVTAASG